MIRAIAVEAAAAFPTWFVSGFSVMGAHLGEMILWATFVYTLLQIGFLVYRWRGLAEGKSEPSGQSEE